MAFFHEGYISLEPNDHDSKYWNGYARETEMGKGEYDGTAADQLEGLDSELKIMQILWTLINRLCVNNVACGLNELFSLLPKCESIWQARKEFLQVPDDPTYYVVGEVTYMRVDGKNVEVVFPDACYDRSVQETTEASVSVYKPVKGWDDSEAKEWFGETSKEELKGTCPPKKHDGNRKHNEDMLVLKSITDIRLLKNHNGPKNYEIRCDYEEAFTANPLLRDTQFQRSYLDVLKTKIWNSSEDFVRTLPFQTIKAYVPGKWYDSNAHAKKLNKYLSQIDAKKLNNYQLWRMDNRDPVIRATTAQGKEIFVNSGEASADFIDEPWTGDKLRTLSFVRSYCVVRLSEGARAACDDGSFRNGPPDPWENPMDSANNIWWSRENSHKNCLVGSITNLLHHMQAGDDAVQFRRLSALDEKSLLKELNKSDVPKNIITRDGTGRDEFGRCLWLLREKFKCVVTKPVRVDQFGSVPSLVENAKKVKFPLVLSIETTSSTYKHVICVWRNMIIDFKEDTTIPLMEKTSLIRVAKIQHL